MEFQVLQSARDVANDFKALGNGFLSVTEYLERLVLKIDFLDLIEMPRAS